MKANSQLQVNPMLYERLLSVITNGYLYRNPLQPRDSASVIHMLSTRTPEEVQQLIEATRETAPVSLMVTGASGMGKTYGITHLLGPLPQARTHTFYNGRHCQVAQVVWLFVHPRRGAG